MKHVLIASLLALVLTLAVGSAGMAASFVPGYQGESIVFGDYDSLDGCTVGAGYNPADGFTVGAQYVVDGSAYGAFAMVNLEPIILQGEVNYVPGGSYVYGDTAALYYFDLYPLILGFGGGAQFKPGVTDYYLEAAAHVDTGDNLSLYGSVYWRVRARAAITELNCSAGVSIWF